MDLLFQSNNFTGMKIGIIIETKEYEKAWNAFRSTEACPISTMIDCVNIVEWADKTVTF